MNEVISLSTKPIDTPLRRISYPKISSLLELTSNDKVTRLLLSSTFSILAFYSKKVNGFFNFEYNSNLHIANLMI